MVHIFRKALTSLILEHFNTSGITYAIIGENLMSVQPKHTFNTINNIHSFYTQTPGLKIYKLGSLKKVIRSFTKSQLLTSAILKRKLLANHITHWGTYKTWFLFMVKSHHTKYFSRE
jgi:hypothetical protein